MGESIKTPEEFIAEELGIPVSEMSVDEIKKKKDNVIETSFLETPKYILEQISVADSADGGIVDLDGNKCSFVKYSKLTGDYEIVPQFEYKDKLYKPIVDKTLTMKGIYLPSGISEYKNTKELTDQITSFIHRNIQLPPFFEKFIPRLILFYWLFEKFPFIPYLHFVGRTSTGKTTAMKIIGMLCYKAIDTTGSLTIAALFRVATAWKGTFLIDEFEKVGENSREIVAFLKAGTTDRLILRVEGERKKQVEAYLVKSPKMFTSENPISDSGLASRTIVIKMEENTRELPLYFLKEDFQEAQEIRNKLLLWRLRNYDKVNLKDIKYGFPELKVFDRRVQQVITPIYYFSDNETKKDILKFAQEQEVETKNERLESLPGKIFEMMVEEWEVGNEVQVKELTTKLNEQNKELGYKSELTSEKVSRIIRKILGFETEVRGHDKLKWVVRDPAKEEELKEYYGVVAKRTIPPSAPSAMKLESPFLSSELSANEAGDQPSVPSANEEEV